MESEWYTDIHKLIASVRNRKEAGELLQALLTPVEYEEVVKRWQIVKLLNKGETQRSVRDTLSVSIATVTRGSREVKYGTGILQKFYDRLYNQ